MTIALRKSKKRAFALVAVLLLTVLIISTAQTLALFAGTRGVLSARQSTDLQHRLAAESLLLALPGMRADVRADGRTGEVEVYALLVGDCQVNTEILPVRPPLPIRAESELEAGRLVELSRTAGLPADNVALRPITGGRAEMVKAQYLWFDQLVAPTDFEEIFRLTPCDSASDLKPRCWSDLVTFWGDGQAVTLNMTTRVGTDARRWFAVADLQSARVVVRYLGMM